MRTQTIVIAGRSGPAFERKAMVAVAGMAWLATGPIAAQQPLVPTPTFEVASVKRSDPKSTAPVSWCLGGPGSKDPELERCTNSSLGNLICLAYNMWAYDIIAPGWVMMGGADVGYDVTAKLPAGATRDQLRLMMQRLLAERFHLVVHWETRTKSVYTLRLGKSKPKFTASSDEGPGNVSYKIVDGHMLYSMHNKPISTLVNLLVNPLDGQLVDETGLQGNYDLTLEYMPEKNWSAPPPAHPDPSIQNVFTAVEDQLGLKIETKKIPVPVLVVDSADKVPTAN